MFRFASRPAEGQLSESTLTRILANRHGVPLFTLEPAPETEVAGLLQHFDPKTVAAYLTLRGYCSEADRSGSEQDGLALDLLRKRTSVNRLRGTFSSIAEFDTWWQENFPEEPDWRTLPDTERIPLLVEVGQSRGLAARRSAAVREQRFVGDVLAAPGSIPADAFHRGVGLPFRGRH